MLALFLFNDFISFVLSLLSNIILKFIIKTFFSRSVHENERRFKCELCDFTSFAKSAMKRHISAIHEKFKPFNCESCNFRTSYKESLDLHLVNVFDELKFPTVVIIFRGSQLGVPDNNSVILTKK